MKILFSLISVGFKTNSLISALKLRMRLNKKDRIAIPFLMAIVAISLIFIYIILLNMIQTLHGALQPFSQTGVILSATILAGQIFVLVFGFYYMLSVFYFSKDIEFLISLPLKPYQVVFSKFCVILINEYLVLSLLILPILIQFGILENVGIGYWLRLPIIFLCLPIIPLTIASLLVILMMRFVNLSKKKDALIIIGSLVLIIGYFLIQILLQGVKEEQILQLFASENGLVQMMTRKFPPAAWASMGLFKGFSSGFFDFIKTVLTPIILAGILMFAGEKLFYRSYIGLHEISINPKRRGSRKKSSLTFSGYHPIKAIFLRELRMMNRTPIFLLNGILTSVLIPALILVFLIKGGNDSTQLTSLFSTQNAALKILIAAGFCLVSGAINGTASSSFSREGKCFWISKVIPVPFKDQILGKMLHALMVAFLGIVLAGLIIVFFFKMTLLEILAFISLALIGGFSFINIGMIIDLSRPLLDWISPQRAIKQNLNVFLTMLIEIILLVGTAFLSIRLVKFGWTNSQVLLVIFLLYLLLGGFTFTYLIKSAGTKYTKVQN